MFILTLDKLKALNAQNIKELLVEPYTMAATSETNWYVSAKTMGDSHTYRVSGPYSDIDIAESVLEETVLRMNAGWKV